jgi:hypothetical protein
MRASVCHTANLATEVEPGVECMDFEKEHDVVRVDASTLEAGNGVRIA